MNIDKIKDEYTNKMNNTIKNYSDIILSSFTDFYEKDSSNIIAPRYNDIDYLYYINDRVIFYILESAKNGNTEELNKIMPMIPYIIYLLENNYYKQKVTANNFYELGMSKIVGASNEELLSPSNKRLRTYLTATVLREDNLNPVEINFKKENDIKRIIALPIFSFDDKTLFHEINHAVCSEAILKGKKLIVKSGVNYLNKKVRYLNELINDLLSLDVYKIFQTKCQETIIDDYIIDKVLIDVYSKDHKLISNFYEENKEKLKQLSLTHSNDKMKRKELKKMSRLLPH